MAPVTRAKEHDAEGKKGDGADGAKVTLYWLEKSRAQRILWLLEETRIEYDLKTYKRKSNKLADPELKNIHPLGKSPVISVSSPSTDGREIVIAESGNIVEYLIDHFGPGLQPTKYQAGKEGLVGGETEEWSRYRYLMHSTEGSIMPLLVLSIILKAMEQQSPAYVRWLTSMITGAVKTTYLAPNLKAHFDYLEEQLKTSPGGGQYLCGTELTGADIMLSFPLGAAKGRAGLTEEKYPQLWKYVALLEERDAFKRAVQKIIEIEGEYSPNL